MKTMGGEKHLIKFIPLILSYELTQLVFVFMNF
jgi:hypothetical protein